MVIRAARSSSRASSSVGSVHDSEDEDAETEAEAEAASGSSLTRSNEAMGETGDYGDSDNDNMAFEGHNPSFHLDHEGSHFDYDTDMTRLTDYTDFANGAGSSPHIRVEIGGDQEPPDEHTIVSKMLLLT